MTDQTITEVIRSREDLRMLQDCMIVNKAPVYVSTHTNTIAVLHLGLLLRASLLRTSMHPVHTI